MGCDGIVSTGAGIFSPQPLHRTTTRFELSGPWNMSYSIGEETAKLIHRYGNPAQSAHGASVSIGAMPPASFQHCSGICIRIARGCRFITHNQIHNQSYLNIYLPGESPDRGCKSGSHTSQHFQCRNYPWKQVLGVYFQLTSPASSSF
jgi:hypothetical protein